MWLGSSLTLDGSKVLLSIPHYGVLNTDKRPFLCFTLGASPDKAPISFQLAQPRGHRVLGVKVSLQHLVSLKSTN